MLTMWKSLANKCKQGLGPLIDALSPSPRIKVATEIKWSKERSAIKQLNLQAQVGPEGPLLALMRRSNVK